MLAIFPGGLGRSVITVSAFESPSGPCVLPSSDTSIRETLASEFVKQNSAEKSNLPHRVSSPGDEEYSFAE